MRAFLCQLYLHEFDLLSPFLPDLSMNYNDESRENKQGRQRRGEEVKSRMQLQSRMDLDSSGLFVWMVTAWYI
jgi:hypothetical protein